MPRASTRRTCASPAKPLTFAFAEGWAAIPFSVSINKGIYQIAERSRHQHHLLRPGVQAGEGGDLRRAAVAAEAGLRDRLQLAVGRRRGDHEDLRRGEDPGRQHRRLASRTPSSSAPTTTSPARSAARRPANTPRASASAARSRSSTASTPARAMPPPSASPASSTACRRSAAPSPPTASSRRSSTPAPPSRR